MSKVRIWSKKVARQSVNSIIYYGILQWLIGIVKIILGVPASEAIIIFSSKVSSQNIIILFLGCIISFFILTIYGFCDSTYHPKRWNIVGHLVKDIVS
ncbi:hypothetical protein KKH23_04420 [Patescibacteria group bacterium]|nr:hypothetical protein [Patescibacteria group bacterium]